MLCWFLIYTCILFCQSSVNGQNEATSFKQTTEDTNDYEDLNFSQDDLNDYTERTQGDGGDISEEEDAEDLKMYKRKGPFSFYPRWMYKQFRPYNDDFSQAKRVGAFSLMPKFLYEQMHSKMGTTKADVKRVGAFSLMPKFLYEHLQSKASKNNQHEAKRVSSFYNLPKWMYKNFKVKDAGLQAIKRMGLIFHLPKFLKGKTNRGDGRESNRLSSLSLFPKLMYRQLTTDKPSPIRMFKKLPQTDQSAPMTKKLASLPPWLLDDVPEEKKDVVFAASRSMLPRWMYNQFGGSSGAPSPRRSALYQPASLYANKPNGNNALVYKQKKNENTPRWQLMQSNKISKKDLLKLIMMLKYVGKRDRPTRYLDIV